MEIRLILDPPRSAAINMAIDEILAESQKKPQAVPVLRIYFWEKSAYSIGYFQSVQQIARRFHCEEKNHDVVRRLTGGGLVLHAGDVTFSLSFPNPHPFIPRDTKASYLKVNEALLAGLRELYPGIDFADCKSASLGRGKGDRVCFEAPSCYDLMLEGKKVVGASQRRQDGSLLHQSSVFIEGDRTRVIAAILKGFHKKWGFEFLDGPLSDFELALAEEKEESRYASEDWAFPALRLASSFLAKQSGQL